MGIWRDRSVHQPSPTFPHLLIVAGGGPFLVKRKRAQLVRVPAETLGADAYLYPQRKKNLLSSNIGRHFIYSISSHHSIQFNGIYTYHELTRCPSPSTFPTFVRNDSSIYSRTFNTNRPHSNDALYLPLRVIIKGTAVWPQQPALSGTK